MQLILIMTMPGYRHYQDRHSDILSGRFTVRIIWQSGILDHVISGMVSMSAQSLVVADLQLTTYVAKW